MTTFYKIVLLPVNTHGEVLFDYMAETAHAFCSQWICEETGILDHNLQINKAQDLIKDLVLDSRDCCETCKLVGKRVLHSIHDITFSEYYVTFEIGCAGFIPIKTVSSAELSELTETSQVKRAMSSYREYREYTDALKCDNKSSSTVNVANTLLNKEEHRLL